MTTSNGRFKAKPIRTELFVPGNKEDWMRRAPRFNADAYILDIEDSVPVPEKAAARESVAAMVQELGEAGETIVVRVNRLETGLTGEDLEAVAGPHLYCVLLPKVEGPEDVVEVDVLLRQIERRKGLEVGKIFIDPALETASGIRQSWEIATSSPRVAHMGAAGGKGGDTARSIGFQWTPEGMETLFLRSKVLVDVRAAGIPYPMSGGWMDIHDLDGLRKSAQQAKQLGLHRNAPDPPIPRVGGQRGVYSVSGRGRPLQGVDRGDGNDPRPGRRRCHLRWRHGGYRP